MRFSLNYLFHSDFCQNSSQVTLYVTSYFCFICYFLHCDGTKYPIKYKCHIPSNTNNIK